MKCDKENDIPVHHDPWSTWANSILSVAQVMTMDRDQFTSKARLTIFLNAWPRM